VVVVWKPGYSKIVPGRKSSVNERIRTSNSNQVNDLHQRQTFAPAAPQAESAIIGIHMPSPIGHALAGLTVSWLARPVTPHGPAEPFGWSDAVGPLTLACVAAAVLPDLDLIHYAIHRSITHGIGFSILIMIVTAAVTGWVTGRILWGVALIVGAAHASHIVLDWLGTDRLAPFGLQALWPFSHDWYISGWNVFLPTERRDALSLRAVGVNARAALREVAIMGPIAAAAWALRRSRRSRALTSGPGVRRQPSAVAGGRPGTWDRRALRAKRSRSRGRYRGR
jgi:inner membrane protein